MKPKTITPRAPLKGKTVLADRQRDVDGHLLPVHPQDHRKGPR